MPSTIIHNNFPVHIPPIRFPWFVPGSTIIRDRFIIDSAFPRYLRDVAPGRTLTIVARVIEHDRNYNLDLGGRNLTIVAATFTGLGGIIRTTGVDAPPAHSGQGGGPGYSSASGFSNRPGGNGTRGENATNGSPGGTVQVFAETITGLRIVVKGGAGGAGGAGGSGGQGADGRLLGKPGNPIEIEATAGGQGGDAGDGGVGGSGGVVIVSAIHFNDKPMIDVSGGDGGRAGRGGQGGAHGTGLGGDDGSYGAPGRDGVQGQKGKAGTFTKTDLTPAMYREAVTIQLSSTQTEAWATYRLSVGDYFFRTYLPAINSSHADDLKIAVGEYTTAQQLNPALTTECTRQINNIWSNVNALGIQRDLDIVPHFDEYITAFTSFGNLVLGLFNSGVTEVLHAVDLASLQQLLLRDRRETRNMEADANDSMLIAQQERQNIDASMVELANKVESTKQEIEAAIVEMNDHSMSFGQIVGVVGQVATAVVSVIGAIPTGGASLLALVPDVIALSKTILDVAPLVGALFGKDDNDTLKKVKDQYGKAGKDVSSIIDSTKAVISIVALVENLAKGKTPDNTKYVALVQKGLELAHELLLQQRQRTLVEMRMAAIASTIKRGNNLVALTDQMLATLDLSTTTLRNAGLRLIKTAQLKVDASQTFAFWAQRSVEIYTLKNESNTVHLDAGYVHPDIEADYREHFISDAQLIAGYTDSWSQIVGPIDLQRDYLSYWTDHRLQSGIRRLSFTGSDVERFRSSLTFSFALEPEDLGVNGFDTKAQAVFCSFVGATSSSGIISCRVRHGNRYTQQQQDGSRNDQFLQSQDATISAQTERLKLAGVTIGDQPPLTTPQNLAFWGRGVCGRWEVSVEPDEITTEVANLANLTEIQVWIAYQFVRRE
ncbi:hypothetical protein QFC24_001938 [Naganishia onofrii]|uniref:Uncharacterized protein n=1 Tax=Naganishia onofrii TaxID=1851511 RepID=A0ACC2XRE3_9TREE|nr:hypothetical protein QFC24_001938 [Naganishia onofrii]